MKKIMNGINWGLIVFIFIILVGVAKDAKSINFLVNTKSLPIDLTSRDKVVISEAQALENIDNINNKVKEEKLNKNNDNIDKQVEKTSYDEETRTTPSKENKVLATYKGTMSFYQANCKNCTGYTYSGLDVRDGRIYYEDETYGKVRMIAAGAELPQWSIVSIKNSSLGDEALAIVVDRGSHIGLGKTYLIDLLTNSNEKFSGVEKNITIELLRRGKTI